MPFHASQTQVKRASKAAIVNKSIDLINELQRAEAKLAKENEALKAELEALRRRTGSPSASASAVAASNAATAAAIAAQQDAARQTPMNQQHSLFAGMQHPMQLPMPMPMMSHIPAAAMASMAAAAAAGNPLMQQVHQQQQHHGQQQGVPHFQQSLNAAAAAPPTAEMGSHLFPGIFSGLFNANGNGNGVFDSLENARSESGSPASHHSTGSASAAAFAHGLFDLPAMQGFADQGHGSNHQKNTLGGSPSSGYNHSPPGTVASLAGSERTNQSISGTSSSQLTHNGAPSPASSNGIPTPPSNNAAYSPLGLSAMNSATTPQSQVSSSQNNGSTDPVIAAFDGSSDAAYLAAQFAPTDLAKAQHDLQAFIAYQQRMAFASASQGQQAQPHTPTLEHGQNNNRMSPSVFPPPTPGGNAPGFGFAQQQQQQQQQRQAQHMQQQQHQQQQQMNAYGAGSNAGIAGMCGPTAAAAQASMNGMPAWQMMMAQHQAMVAAYGQQPHF